MDSLSKAPRYREVRRQIIDSLARGQWKPGDTLPTERELADRFGVAISTIRAGLAELTTTGVLVRRQGKGTFVAHHNTGPQQFRYSNVYTDDGTKLSTIRVVRSMERVRADAVTAARLKLHTGNARHVYRVEATLQSADGKAIAAMELVLPTYMFPTARREDFEHGTENQYTLYQRKWAVTVLRMEEWVSARNADAKTARILKVKTGHAVMQVDRIAYTFNDVPVEIRKRTYEGLKHRYLFKHDELD